jgi:deferrochelatase/peroxidase EfeB
MSTEPTDAELDHEVQGLPLTGYGASYAVTRNLVLTVTRPADARKFVAALVDSKWLDFGGKRTDWPEQAGVNIGITYEGLRTLGAPGPILALLKQKSPAFAEGAPLRAARVLGDTGASAAERWKRVFRKQDAHLWITIHSDDMLPLEHAASMLSRMPGAVTGLAGWQHPDPVPDGGNLSDAQDTTARMVHFGLRDNLTRPSILDAQSKLPKPGAPVDASVLPAGELLLGYPNRSKADVWTPNGTPEAVAGFLRNGTFGVLRQIQQDEAALDDFLEQQVDALADTPFSFATKTYLKAKLCGRWPNGMPVLPHATQQPPWRPGHNPDFDRDREGLGCPFGAHIRRANPRTDPLRPEHQRALFRRSMPYGAPYAGTRDDIERGLLGVFFCGRIDDQFELLVSEWLEKNPLGPPNRGRAKDPISGRHDEADAAFHIPLKDGPGIMLKGFEPFVRTRGTLYALFPSRTALTAIAVADAWRPA